MRDIGGDGHLMRDGIDPAADESAHGRGLHAAAPFDGLSTQGKSGQFVDVGREETLLRAAETEGVGEFGLRDAAWATTVDQGAVDGTDRVDGQLGAITQRDSVACLEAGTAQRGAVACITPRFSGSGETQLHEAALDVGDDAEAEFGLALTEPTLAGCRGFHPGSSYFLSFLPKRRPKKDFFCGSSGAAACGCTCC